jgi:hypothetical protein
MNGTTNFISRGADVAYSRGMVVVTAREVHQNLISAHLPMQFQ